MKVTKLTVLFLIIFFGRAHAQDTATPKTKAEQFFTTLMQGKVDMAYDSLFQGSMIAEQKPQAVELLKRQTKLGLPMYGRVLGFELSKEQRFGKSVVRLVYILKLERHPMVWEFYFYRPKSIWILSNVRFNDQFQLIGEK